MTDAGQDLMRIEDVVAMTGIAEATLRYMRQMNVGPPSFRLGRRVVYRRSALVAWIANQESETSRGDAA